MVAINSNVEITFTVYFSKEFIVFTLFNLFTNLNVNNMKNRY